MSFNINFTGHIDPEDPAKDAIIRKLARAFVDTLRAAGIECYGSVSTPTLNGGTPMDLPDGGPLLVVEGTHIYTAGPATGGSPTNTKPK